MNKLIYILRLNTTFLNKKSIHLVLNKYKTIFEENRVKISIKAISSKMLSKEQEDIQYYHSYILEMGIK